MYVIYDTHEKTDCAMICFYNNQDEQKKMMDNQDIDDQVKEWQETHTGNPPKFYSRITIKEFTNRELRFSNI